MSVSVTRRFPIPIEKRLVGVFAGSWDATHALVNVRQPLDDRSRAIITLERFLAGGANSFCQCQFSDAREPPHSLRCGFVLECGAALMLLLLCRNTHQKYTPRRASFKIGCGFKLPSAPRA
jgi:hypothetical protein